MYSPGLFISAIIQKFAGSGRSGIGSGKYLLHSDISDSDERGSGEPVSRRGKEVPLSNQNAVKMVDITKTFDVVLANNKICLDINYGEVLALLGENGSGKTTLMNMLSGIYAPDSGDIYVNGKHAVINDPARGRVTVEWE